MEQLILLVELWCAKIDPTRVNYCTDYVVECVLDGEKESWCAEDYKAGMSWD